MVEFRTPYPKFNKVISTKIEELSNEGSDYYRRYFQRTFEPNKKYCSKAKNRIVKLKNYTHSVMCFLKIFKKVREEKPVAHPISMCSIM